MITSPISTRNWRLTWAITWGSHRKPGNPNTSVGTAKALSHWRRSRTRPSRKVAILAADGVDAADVQAMQGAADRAGAAVGEWHVLGMLVAVDGTKFLHLRVC